MAPTKSDNTEASSERAGLYVRALARSRFQLRHKFSSNAVSYIYLAVALPTAILLCFLTPPMQSPDEGRHFLRAVQIASGHFISEMDSKTQRAGGIVPTAVLAFVREKMTPDYFRNEDSYHTIRERLRVLDSDAQSEPAIEKETFASFATATIYPLSLYLPQSAGIVIGRALSRKVYVWFYSGRLANALSAVCLIFVALRLAPAYQPLLIIPALLPTSIFQISSISSDASIISLSIVFVALCIRFLDHDSLFIRGALLFCLLILVTGKPVFLPLALLTLVAHKRLGWLKAIVLTGVLFFVSGGAYLAWSRVVHHFLTMAAREIFPGCDPPAQFSFLVSHPISFLLIALRTVRLEGALIIRDMIGKLGWGDLPLPRWIDEIWLSFFVAIVLFGLTNRRTLDRSRVIWGASAAAGCLAALFVAAFVLWTPVGSTSIPWIQGRYLIPILPVLVLFFPGINQMSALLRKTLLTMAVSVVAISTVATIYIAKHYYFQDSLLSGKNLYQLFPEPIASVCPAEGQQYKGGQFSSIAKGYATVRYPRVLLANEQGIIMAESDPALADYDLWEILVPSSVKTKWLVHLWTLNETATLRYWIVTNRSACTFGAPIKLEPYTIPET